MSSHAVKEYTPLNIHMAPAAKPAARPVRPFVVFAVVLAGLLVGWAACSLMVRSPLYGRGSITPGTEPSSVSIILTADNGDMVGTSEGGELKALLMGITTKPCDAEHLFCEEVLHGSLFGLQVMLVTTGIGHDRAALCLRSLLQMYHPVTKEIMFLGTGGFSPARGGIVNSDDCDLVSPAASTELVPLGSVCVSPMTTTWDCQKCVWPASVKSACAAELPCSLHGRADLFGDWGCEYWTTTSLADEMIGAARSLALPLPSPSLAALQGDYWSAMANGTGEPFDRFLGDLRPKVFDYTQCAEATSNTFWVGTPYDELARTYVATLVNHAFDSPLLNGAFGGAGPAIPLAGGLVTKRDTVAVSAMESAGWMEVLALEEVFLHYPRIPAVNVRGAADYVTPPLSRRRDGTWEELASYSAALAGDALTVEGYDLAIQSTSALVVNLFRTRSTGAQSG